MRKLGLALYPVTKFLPNATTNFIQLHFWSFILEEISETLILLALSQSIIPQLHIFQIKNLFFYQFLDDEKQTFISDEM